MPRKAVWLEFESDGDAEFVFFLAEKLGRTAAEVLEVSNDEFMRWSVYFGRKAQQRELAAKQGRR